MFIEFVGYLCANLKLLRMEFVDSSLPINSLLESSSVHLNKGVLKGKGITGCICSSFSCRVNCADSNIQFIERFG